MRIVQVIDSLEAGGAEKMAVSYANALATTIDFSGIVTTRREGVLQSQLDTNVSYLFLNKKGTLDFSAVFRLKKYCKKHKVKILQAHSSSYFIAVLVKLIYPKIKIVWHNHNGLSEFVNSDSSIVLKIAPPFLVVVVLGIFLNLYSSFFGITEQLGNEHLIQLPPLSTAADLFLWNKFSLDSLLNSAVWMQAFIIAIVASLETILNIEATDKFDEEKRITPPNRELVAQGIGNIFSGLFGGLPVTSVVVRSSSNRLAGAKTKWSAILHGFWLLCAILFLGQYLNLVPLSALAAILIFVGFKLTKPSIFRDLWFEGISQFLPFIATFLAIYFSDMLKGVLIGIAFGMFFIIRTNFKSAIQITKGDNNDILLRFRKDVSFLNKPLLKKTFMRIPPNSYLLIDARKCEFMDPDIIEIIQDFVISSKSKNIRIELNKNNWGELPQVLKTLKL